MSAAILAACASAAPPSAGPAAPGAALTADATKAYQPLAVGDYWKFICGNSFTIQDRVTGSRQLRGRLVYALSLQIPNSPKKSVYVVQLLGNDPKGNTWIYGYLIHGKVVSVKPTEIVAAKPVLNKHYDYPNANHAKISRVFVGFEYTNKTPLGVFWVAPYFESGGTHNYGYSLGRGVMEEDHGPHFKYDCLIEKFVLR
ncbi:MAG TPA: hypothetical protein VIW73_12625 [Candidatus Cybelea sp.]